MIGHTWLTHPNLTPANDWACPDAAVGQWVGGGAGWQVREDQSDPAEDLDEPTPALAADGQGDHHDDAAEHGEHETPAADAVPDENDEHDTEEGS